MKFLKSINYLSHCLNVHDAIIQSETINTNNTVPGHIVIRVLKTNLFKNKSLKKRFENLIN